MFVRTHWLIADAVTRALPSQMSACLISQAFCLGSILPDLLAPYNQIPHCLEQSQLFLRSFIAHVRSSPPDQEQWNASLKLGMLTHFLSDCFCLAHNQPEFKKPFPHAVYETRLAALVKSKTLRTLAQESLSQPSDPRDALTYLKAKHLSYLEEVPGPDTDFAYVMQVTTSVVVRLLRQESTILLEVA